MQCKSGGVPRRSHRATNDSDDAAHRLFPAATGSEPLCDATGAPAKTWMGRRPLSPDSMPICGRTEVPNLLLNTGHGADGWRFSHGTAVTIADLVQGRESRVDLDALSPARFYLV